MLSESDDRRPARLQHGSTLPPEPEHLPCPRCDSTDTKFCYYNNYNLSQPRHFCKSCRRYWTRGGTLRNVPVGGSTRKNHSKRSRTTTAAATTPSSSPSDSTLDPVPTDPTTMIPGYKPKVRSPLWADVNLNENLPEDESFPSLLDTTGAGFFALGGFMSGAGYGFREFGLGAGLWHGGGGEGVAGATSGCSTWQVGGGGSADGDFFNRPELAISTPGNSLK